MSGTGWRRVHFPDVTFQVVSDLGTPCLQGAQTPREASILREKLLYEGFPRSKMPSRVGQPKRVWGSLFLILFHRETRKGVMSLLTWGACILYKRLPSGSKQPFRSPCRPRAAPPGGGRVPATRPITSERGLRSPFPIRPWEKRRLPQPEAAQWLERLPGHLAAREALTAGSSGRYHGRSRDAHPAAACPSFLLSVLRSKQSSSRERAGSRQALAAVPVTGLADTGESTSKYRGPK